MQLVALCLRVIVAASRLGSALGASGSLEIRAVCSLIGQVQGNKCVTGIKLNLGQTAFEALWIGKAQRK